VVVVVVCWTRVAVTQIMQAYASVHRVFMLHLIVGHLPTLASAPFKSGQVSRRRNDLVEEEL
jgi:hypothetical protein